MNKIKSQWISICTKTLRILVPNLALKIVKKALFKPKRKTSNWPSHVTQFELKTRYGRLSTYKYGEGRCIWLIHGWSGCAFDFWPLMQKLAEKGYSTISYDFPGHGESAGDQSSLPQMIKAFDDVSANLFAPSMVISHGLGASVIANSRWIKNFNNNLLLISPVLDVYQFLQNRIFYSGLNEELFELLIKDISKREKMNLPELCATPKLKAFAGKLKIIHDTNDELAPFTASETFSQKSKVTLVSTNKLGHNKILHSQKILNTIDSFDTYHDTDNIQWHNVS